MAVHFEATDPRGHHVVCTDDSWRFHVLGRHKWMEGREEETKRALEQPLFICRDADFPNRQVYYFLRADVPRYLKVVVEFTPDGDEGTVVTVFPADAAKAGEQLLWTRSSR